MINLQKIVAQAEHHIRRGDPMQMDPQAVKDLAQRCRNAINLLRRIEDMPRETEACNVARTGLALLGEDTIGELLASVTKINEHVGVTKTGEAVFFSPEQGHDLSDYEHLNCPLCGGSGHVGDAQPVLAEIYANDQRWRHFIGFLSDSDRAVDFHERFPSDRVPTPEEYVAAIDADRAAHMKHLQASLDPSRIQVADSGDVSIGTPGKGGA